MMFKKKVLLPALLSASLIPVTVAATQSIPSQVKDEKIYNSLPQKVKEKGAIDGVFDTAFPPFATVKNNQLEGVSADLAQALGELLGIKIESHIVTNFPSMLSGIQAGRYQIIIGPVADFPERQAQYDFVDFMRDMSVFVVRKGNPQRINSLADTCGKRIAVTKGGASEQALIEQSTRCVTEKKASIEIQGYPDTASNILALLSNRADGVVVA
ncbi:MAG: transporter substrate-binding domain-containing protein [Enterobacteriaceae bacterium]